MNLYLKTESVINIKTALYKSVTQGGWIDGVMIALDLTLL